MLANALLTQPVVIMHDSELSVHSFLEDNVYKASYTRLAEFARYRNIDLRFVTGLEKYSDRRFHSYWKYGENGFTKIDESFTASVVFLKVRTPLLDAEVRVNNTALENICRDKYLTYLTYPQFVKKTVKMDQTGMVDLEGDSVVVKPRFGSEGHGVRLVEKTHTQSVDSSDEYIVQEIIDSSHGIPGLIDSRHEMRVYVFNGLIQSAYLRIPAKDSFLTNISQGASVRLMDKSQIPRSAYEMIQHVDAEFRHIYPRLYSVDLMYENSRPWVVELNDMPGMPDVDVQPLADNFFNDLLDLLTGSFVRA